MKKTLLFILFISSITFSQNNIEAEKWKDLKFLIGKWEGTGSGKFGVSKVEREYSYFMGGTYLLGKNKSTYEKQEKNPGGEIHVNWDIYSYDKYRKKYVIRQFHEEDITNTFSADSSDVTDGEYEFVYESIENFMPGWKAKEVYSILNEDEFIEIFYLAPPGKKYSEFIRNTFKRVN
jgi:hypothetical protein